MLALFTGGWTWVLKLLADPKKLLYIGAGLLSAFIMWEVFKFINTALDNAVLVEQQRIEIQLKDSELAATQFQLDQTLRAAEISDEARTEQLKNSEKIDEIRENILNSEIDDDGELAPVLKEVLRALRD